MKCPACNNEIMSFFQFYLWSNPITSKCNSCGTKLKPNSIIKKIIYIEIFIAFFLVIFTHSMLGLLTFRGLFTFITVSAILLYPLEKYAWENGSYMVKE